MSGTFAERAKPALEAGWPVFPCGQDKAPLVKGGFHKATMDRAIIETWSKENPDALIGIPTGAASGLDVLDIDPRHGGNEWLAANKHRLQGTRAVSTRSGGVHYYFKATGLRCTTHAIAPGVDTRAKGGYVIDWAAEGGTVKQADMLANWPEGLDTGRSASVSGDKVALENRIAPPSAGAVVELLEELPNPLETTRDEWLAVLMAVRGCVQSLEYADNLSADQQGAIEDALFDWCDRWPAAQEEDPRTKWENDITQRDATTGWENLGRIARRATPGYSEAQSASAAMAGFGELPVPVETVPGATAVAGNKLRMLTFDEIDAMPDPTFTVDALLPDQSFVVVYGPPKQGKTFLVMSMAVHIAAGKPWFGREVKKGGVVYIAGEGAGGLKHRLRALRQYHGLGSDLPFWVVPRAVHFGKAEAVRDLAALIRETAKQGFKLLVIDTLARATPGMDENSAGDMGRFVEECDKIKREFGCTVLVVHHSGKDASRGGRGSSALPGAVDASFQVTREKTDTDDIITLTNEYQKEAEEAAPLHFDLVKVETSLVPVLRQGGLAKAVKLSAAAKAAMRHFERAMDGDCSVDGDAWKLACVEDDAVSSASRDVDRRKAFYAVTVKLEEQGQVTRAKGTSGRAKFWKGYCSEQAGSGIEALSESGSKWEHLSNLPLQPTAESGSSGSALLERSHAPTLRLESLGSSKEAVSPTSSPAGADETGGTKVTPPRRPSASKAKRDADAAIVARVAGMMDRGEPVPPALAAKATRIAKAGMVVLDAKAPRRAIPRCLKPPRCLKL